MSDNLLKLISSRAKNYGEPRKIIYESAQSIKGPNKIEQMFKHATK